MNQTNRMGGCLCPLVGDGMQAISDHFVFLFC